MEENILFWIFLLCDLILIWLLVKYLWKKRNTKADTDLTHDLKIIEKEHEKIDINKTLQTEEELPAEVQEVKNSEENKPTIDVVSDVEEKVFVEKELIETLKKYTQNEVYEAETLEKENIKLKKEIYALIAANPDLLDKVKNPKVLEIILAKNYTEK